MEKITSDEFKTLIKKDPAWASKIKKPYEITDYCDMYKSEITDLSPLLTFSGNNGDGKCAGFQQCKNLKIATGNFIGYVNFDSSEISEIKNLNIHNPDKYGVAANFYACKNLKIATGNYPGSVSFAYSGISEIKNLFVGKNKHGYSTYFDACKNLKILSGNFEGIVYVNPPIETLKDFNASVLVSDDLKILKKFYSSKKLSELKEILFNKTNESLIKRLHPTIEKEIELKQKLEIKSAGIQLHGF